MIVTGWSVIALQQAGSFDPEVREDFFFAEDDPAMQQMSQLARRFGVSSPVLITARSDSIGTEQYEDRLRALTRALRGLSSVVSVKSLTNGPGSFEAAKSSPFWGPLLLTDDGKGSNLLVVIKGNDDSQAIAALEALAAEHNADDFDLYLAGAPYVTEMLQRDLATDLKRTGTYSLLVMLLVVALLYRSIAVMLGCLTAGVAAVAMTIMAQQQLGVPLGILSANLMTIVIVLVVSHAVFLTGNWQQERPGAGSDDPRWQRLSAAWRKTLKASFWCMVTTFLGFATLLAVEAEPLRQLGMGGTIGCLCALLGAYLVFPVFLLWTDPSQSSKKFFWLRERNLKDSAKTRTWMAASAVAIAALCSLAIPKLDMDPDIFAYFNDEGPVETSLRYIDRNGGSSPLLFSVRHRGGLRLDDEDTYEKLLQLNSALEDDPAVGTVISLPLIMAEADDHPLAFLFSFERLISFLQSDKFDRIADRFITADRRSAFFLLRMTETDRGSQPRLDVVERLRETATSNDFHVELVGGVYYLQGKLAEMVRESLWQGLIGLLVAIFVIALIIGRSIRLAAAVFATSVATPVFILGTMSLLGMPLDLIASPAVIIAIGMAVDMTLHLIHAVGRAGSRGWQAWAEALDEQRQSILGATVIVAGGFAVLGMSSFPPTGRFGFAVVVGTLVAAAFSLWVLPMLVNAEIKLHFRTKNGRAI